MDNKIIQILEQVKKEGVAEINLQFSDLFGAIKSFAIPSRQLPEALERGVWFDGSSIEGFTRIAESDMFLKPDLNTYSLIPWEDSGRTARFICDVYRPDGNPYEGDPRFILKRALKEAEGLGYQYNVGPELEFFLFKIDGSGNPITHDQAGYFDFAPTDLGVEVRRDIVSVLEKMGFNIEASHHEVAPGQHEIDFKYSDALTTADRGMTFKYVVKIIAKKHGLEATFMPKPVQGINGSGMHVHQSLSDFEGKNVFFDMNDEYRLSETAKYFIAGQLAHVRSIAAVLAPNVNSYKRLVPGYEAPVYICWGRINRSALIRVPKVFQDRPQATRLELRCPDPSSNLYLTFATMLKAGLAGLKEKQIPSLPIEEDVYEFDDSRLAKESIGTLPESLGEAIKLMEKDVLVKETFGETTYEKYLKAKKAEWDEFRLHVSYWEKEKYFKA